MDVGLSCEAPLIIQFHINAAEYGPGLGPLQPCGRQTKQFILIYSLTPLICSGPAMEVVTLWGVNQHLEVLSVFWHSSQ